MSRSVVALVKEDFEAICAATADYVHRSRFRTAPAKLEQLLSERRILFCGTGGLAEPFANIEVNPQEDLEHTLYEAFYMFRGGRRAFACLLDAKAVVFAKGLNDRLPRERVVWVSGSPTIENVLSEGFPHLLPHFCSLESFFLLMLWDGRDSTSWYRKLDAEITTAISAIEEIGARSAAGLSGAGRESLAAERSLEAVWDSLEGLVNQRLGDAMQGREWLFHEMRDTPALADRQPRVAVTDRKLELLLGFVKFVSQDEDFRQQVRQESLRTWHQVASSVDRLRQLGRYQVQYSCFISYATKDLRCAQKVVKDLREAGVRCWYAPDSLKVGADFSQEIENAIRMHDRLIVIVSESSVRTEWVRREVEAGLEMERMQDRRVVVPLILDDELERSQVSWVAFLRRTRQAADFRGWEEVAAYGDALERLLRGLRGDEA